ncbi:MAG: efflux RND transporter periplasmic adaptor subunit, partial [Candidatus Eisenbacteria bacterium]
MKGRTKALLIGGGALLVTLVIVANVARSSGGKTAVQVGEVKKGTITSTVRAPGRTQPETMVKVSADVPGKVIRLAIKEGDPVRRGQFLLQIDDIEYRAQVANAEAALQAARSNLRQGEAAFAQSDAAMKRKESLFDQKLVSPEELDVARTTRDSDKARLDARREDVAQGSASLVIARDRLRKTRFVSPIDGTVTQLAIEEGEIVITGTMNNPGTVILTVADLRQMKVEADVDETDVSSVRIDQKSKVTVDALPDTSLAGHVTEIANSPTISGVGSQDQQTNFLVDVMIDAPPAMLRPGMTADVEITTATRDSVLLVPIQAVVVRTPEELVPLAKRGARKKKDVKGAAPGSISGKDGAKAEEIRGVFVMDKEGKVAFRKVTTGLSSDTDYEVSGELKPGEKIVTGPFRVLRTLKPEQRVRVEEPKK